jgi:hypothetical protein
MDEGIAVIFGALITVIGGVIITIINKAEKTVSKAEKSVTKAERSIKDVSGLLPSWTLLLEHDEQGTPISGNMENLIEAVNKGFPIKVRINETNGGISVMEAEWLFVKNNVVYASNSNQISVTSNEDGDYIFQERPYHYYVLIGSNGHHHAKRVYINGRDKNPTDSKCHMAWIGLIPLQKK